MMRFTNQSMQEIFPLLQDALKKSHTIYFEVYNPDLADYYAGEEITLDNIVYLYRGYKAWTDLASLLHCKMLTPEKSTFPLIKLSFKKLEIQNSFHRQTEMPTEEKYGINSSFASIHKMEEPSFFYYYLQALKNIHIENKTRILNLGINKADELEVIKKQLDIRKYQNMDFVGIDHSKTAISYAKAKFPEKNVTFYVHDINHLDALKLGQFDVLISIGTLQSPNIQFKPFFMSLVQKYLTKDAAIILGFPNSRWVGGEMLYGAKAPNYAMSEMSLLFNDVMFCKKYLQQKKYRVTLTGKYYIFLTATKIH